MLLHEIIANTLVTIYSPPGVNAIGSTRVLPMAKDVPEGTTHVSDGLDGLLAGQYRTQYGKYDLTDKLIWVYVDHLSNFRAAFVYYDGMLLRKATQQETDALVASHRSDLRIISNGVSLRVSEDPVSPEAKGWLPARKLFPEEVRALGKGNEAKIAKLARRHAQDDIKSRSNPNLSTPLPILGDAANVARLTTWRTLSDAYEDAKMDDIADQLEAVLHDDEDGDILRAAMAAWDYYYDAESLRLIVPHR